MSPPSDDARARARRDLDGLVVSMELTLISVIQGTALYFLVNTSFADVAGLHYRVWPYLFSGLLIIFLFWTRALLHTLTVIGWPLEFGHNFIYIAATLLEAVMFNYQANPLAWHAVSIPFWSLLWFLFVFDLKMLRRGHAENPGPAFSRLLGVLEKEQRINIWFVMPAAVLYYIVATVLLYRDPASEYLAWGLGIAQCVSLVGYLAYVLKFYERLVPMVLEVRAES